MTSRFQAASLVASPSYPNAVAWSDDNLVAVSSGHIVTILNPALPFGPRGLITIPASKGFPIGVVDRKELLSGCLLPICLSRDVRPEVRSVAWSPVGLAPNAGCLLAICTTEGHVKLYRFPYGEFSAEWVEVLDISEMLYDYLVSISFGELEIPFSELYDEQASPESMGPDNLPISVLGKKPKRRRQDALAVINKDSATFGDQFSCSGYTKKSDPRSTRAGKSITAFKEVVDFPYSILREGLSVEVLVEDSQQHFWVSGILDHSVGAKALVKFPETYGNGKQDVWVEMNPEFDYIDAPNLVDDAVSDQVVHFSRIRPSMKVGNLPEQILLGNCHGVEEILKIGQAVEVWKNDRWIEGIFMGLNRSGLLVKLYGDSETVLLDASSVRLAPSWINEQKSWQVTVVQIEMKGLVLHKAADCKFNDLMENNQHQIVCMPNSKVRSLRKISDKCSLPLITADQYASRSAMLSSLIVSWSPTLPLTPEVELFSPNDSPKCCSLLAVGGKAGKISFWRICEPQCYSVMPSRDPVDASLVGLMQAHNTWVTTIGWALFCGVSDPQLLLATGSSDGSVKIWLGQCPQLLKSSEVSHSPFSLLKEVISVDSVPVSVLSLIVPVRSPHKMLLAVGKGSGAFEVWTSNISTRKFDRVVSHDVHDHIVTGLGWAFDGCCLYSCSQDNSIRSWILHEGSLCEVPIPANVFGVEISTDVPNVFDSCLGLAVSPGNLVLAVARSFDADLLNPMYQARTQKAAVEFLWIGGQQLDTGYNSCPESNVEAFPGFFEKDLVYWELNILWSLRQYELLDKHLVVWDVIAALLAFRQCSPKYTERILVKWLMSYLGHQLGVSTAKILSKISGFLSKIASRKLHLLNIINRRVILRDLKPDTINKKQNTEELCGAEEELTLWTELLLSSEAELRGRLVGFNFSVVLHVVSHSLTKFCKPGYWRPAGLKQMDQWVSLTHNRVQDHLKLLASKIGKLDKSGLQSTCEYAVEEQCSYCSASVPFESPEAAFCTGVKDDGEIGQSHRLARCAVSMQVCSSTPLWFCSCCQRWASKLAPLSLFKIASYASDIESFPQTSSTLELSQKPLCPFCGILLQRSQPEFLLSASPV